MAFFLLLLLCLAPSGLGRRKRASQVLSLASNVKNKTWMKDSTQLSIDKARKMISAEKTPMLMKRMQIRTSAFVHAKTRLDCTIVRFMELMTEMNQNLVNCLIAAGGEEAAMKQCHCTNFQDLHDLNTAKCPNHCGEDELRSIQSNWKAEGCQDPPPTDQCPQTNPMPEPEPKFPPGGCSPADVNGHMDEMVQANDHCMTEAKDDTEAIKLCICTQFSDVHALFTETCPKNCNPAMQAVIVQEMKRSGCPAPPSGNCPALQDPKPAPTTPPGGQDPTPEPKIPEPKPAPTTPPGGDLAPTPTTPPGGQDPKPAPTTPPGGDLTPAPTTPPGGQDPMPVPTTPPGGQDLTPAPSLGQGVVLMNTLAVSLCSLHLLLTFSF